jgi:hypothetical protein
MLFRVKLKTVEISKNKLLWDNNNKGGKTVAK